MSRFLWRDGRYVVIQVLFAGAFSFHRELKTLDGKNVKQLVVMWVSPGARRFALWRIPLASWPA